MILSACGVGENQPPVTTSSSTTPIVVAHAEPHQSVYIGTFVRLDGSKSTNANQTGLTYSWTLEKPANSKATLSDPNIVNPTLTVDVEGTYEATLIVSDAQNASLVSAPAAVLVIASGTNPPPVANAGAERSAFVGLPVVLNGSGSRDPDNNSLTFNWSFSGVPGGSKAALLDHTTVAPSFTPDVDGTYEIRLVVNDGTNDSTPAAMIVTASNKPSPTAVASTTSSVLYFPLNTETIFLDGSHSHTNPSGGELAYAWTFNSPNTGTPALRNPDKPKSSFSPSMNVAATYVAQLTVTETNHPGPQPNFHSDTVSIILGPLAAIKASLLTNPPTSLFTCTLDPCDTATIPVNTPIQLDGGGSGVKPLDYRWRITNPSTGAVLNNPTDEMATFKADTAEPGGTTYSLELEVTDQSPAKNKSVRPFNITVKEGRTIAIDPDPSKPGVPTTVKVSLSPSSTDAALRYTWELTSKPSGSHSVLKDPSPDSTNQSNEFTTDKSGNYIVKLTVRDTSTTPNTISSATTTITANNKPTARIKVSPDPPNVCSTVELRGTSSEDSDGTVASYSWTLTRPDGSNSVLARTDSSTTSFKADKPHEYKVTLVVTDNFGSTDTKKIQFTPEPNRTGETIFNESGLEGMPAKTFLGNTGPKCTACHGPGNNASGHDLSKTDYDERRIKNRVIDLNHTGGKTTLTDPGLTSQISALRQFLNSKLPNCP